MSDRLSPQLILYRRNQLDSTTRFATPPSTAGSTSETISTNDEDARKCDEWDIFSDFDRTNQPFYSQQSRSTTVNSYRISPPSSPRDQLNDEVSDTGSDSDSITSTPSSDVPDRHEEPHESSSYDELDNMDRTKKLARSPSSYTDRPRESDRFVEGSGHARDTVDLTNTDLLPSSRSAVSTSSLNSTQPGSTPTRIQVYVRIRPHNREESEADSVVCADDPKSLRITSITTGSVTESVVDQVFTQKSTQEDVYSAVCQGVSACLEGINATIFAYGQTGTGKTFTMFGDDIGVPQAIAIETEGVIQRGQASRDWGLIPRALWELCNRARSANTTSCIKLSCSFIQIYNDRVFDLLTDRKRQKPLVLREQPTAEGGTNVVLQGLSSERLSNFGDALQVIQRGRANRSVRETELNANSSRSHAIVQINVSVEESLQNGNKRIRTSRLNLVDLAGSEKWNTDIDMEEHHAAELKNINTSLSALGNCIAALAESGRRHIPYRDSTLTRLLQDSFGGNALAFLIATISPCRKACEETIRTLQFADRARSVMQIVRVNESFNGNSELLVAKAHIKALRERLSIEQRRRHETRIKEHETLQRDFTAKLQEKEEELIRIRRDNEVFAKWREEDTKRIRALEARIKEVESSSLKDELQFERNETPILSDLRISSEVNNNQLAGEQTARQQDNGYVRKTLTRKTSTRARKNPALESKLPHVQNERVHKHSYRSLMDKYSYVKKDSPSIGQREVPKQHSALHSIQKPMNAVPEQPIEDISSSSPVSPQKRAQPMLYRSDTVPSSIARVFESAGQCPLDTPTVSSGATFSSMPEMQRVSVAQTQVTTLWKPESLPILTKLDPVQGMQSLSNATVSVSPGPNRDFNHKDYAGMQVWSLPIIQSSASNELSSLCNQSAFVVPSTNQVCAKHTLQGCVLCAVNEAPSVSANATSTLSTFKSGSSMYSSGVRSPRMPIDTRQSCERHQLPGCFICAKPTSDSSWRLPLSSFGVTSSSAVTVSENKTFPPIANSPGYPTSSNTKCSTHMLTNCVLCTGTKPSAAPPSLDLYASALNRSFQPPESALWRSNQITNIDSNTSMNSSSGSLSNLQQVGRRDPPYVPSSSVTQSVSPGVRSNPTDIGNRKQFHSLVREASDAATIALRRRSGANF